MARPPRPLPHCHALATTNTLVLRPPPPPPSHCNVAVIHHAGVKNDIHDDDQQLVRAVSPIGQAELAGPPERHGTVGRVRFGSSADVRQARSCGARAVSHRGLEGGRSVEAFACEPCFDRGCVHLTGYPRKQLRGIPRWGLRFLGRKVLVVLIG